MKLKFKPAGKDDFYFTLRNRVDRFLKINRIEEKAFRILYLKFAIYFSIYVFLYCSIVLHTHTSLLFFILNYTLLGICGILLAFNTAHDAIHHTFSKSKKVNAFIYNITFNLQGTSAYLWHIRHNSSHHIFANVDGCDADIDNNPFMRLSPTHPKKPHFKYQHLYATFIYMIYSLHWIFVKDIIYLRKKNLANLKDIKHSKSNIIQVIAWKFIYIFLLLVLPLLAGYSFQWVIIAFLIMHAAQSLFFIWTSIISHLTAETEFPVADEKGNLPYNYYQHQLAVSLDYYPESKIANWIFGGFNAHAAHHLFPHMPHTMYAYISPIIKKTAKEFNYPYNELPMWKAIISHYKYLKVIGNG
ncbi:MAG: acyl-CoA desaturase [Fimbriimonadaceae bacterium]|nr:acyl-CoA desaturase [Chitinophagales bacterium]